MSTLSNHLCTFQHINACPHVNGNLLHLHLDSPAHLPRLPIQSVLQVGSSMARNDSHHMTLCREAGTRGLAKSAYS